MPDTDYDSPFEPTPTGAVDRNAPVMARPIQCLIPAVPLELGTLSKGIALIDVAVILLLALLMVPILALFAGGTITDALGLGDVDAPFLVIHQWFSALAMMGIMWLLLFRHELPPTAFGITGVPTHRVLLWAGAGLLAAYAVIFCVMVAFMIAFLVFPTLESLLAPELEKRQEFFDQMPVDSLWVSCILLVAVAINEEIIFRGLLLPYLRRLTGKWWSAILISSLIFGCLHYTQGWLAILPLMTIGAALAVVFVVSRSLIAVIIAHFLFDLLQFQLIRFLMDMPEVAEQAAS